ncbi:Werner syndrome ATP-dependent helicase-like [Patiria miniata]|nr:Werner syndrome ATP-dependent helicase-like [Patiria miniata]
MTECGVPYNLKPEQIQIIRSVLERRKNVFGLLPTGFGKSDCYGWLSSIMDKIETDVEHITLVISPLRSLMLDQVERWSSRGVTCAAIMRADEIDDATKEEITEGKFQLIFSSPEAILRHKWWSAAKRWANRLTAVVIDEAHCMTKWGTFRDGYKNISTIRSILSQQPVVCLTATATQSMVEDIIHTLNLEVSSFEIIAVLPDRPNIKIHAERVDNANFAEQLKWYADLLKGKEAPKAIIYSRQVNEVANIYAWLMSSLNEMAWAGSDRTVHNRIVEMYHGSTDQESQKRIVSSFAKSSSPLRCVVATMAFGMGVQINDVDFVIHWGPSRDVLSYWQEVGRCARDGRQGHSYLYLYPRSVNKRMVDHSMMEVCASVTSNQCVRAVILQHLYVSGMQKLVRGSCQQCCNGCEE